MALVNVISVADPHPFHFDTAPDPTSDPFRENTDPDPTLKKLVSFDYPKNY